MAITKLEIIQDNIVSNVKWLTINNRLCFICSATYTGVTPSSITVYLMVGQGAVSQQYKAIPLKDISSTERYFIFFAEPYIKAFIPPFEDQLQTIGIEYNVTPSLVVVEFIDWANDLNVSVQFYALNGARQLNNPNGACAVDLWNNEYNTFIGVTGGYVYIYLRPTERTAVDALHPTSDYLPNVKLMRENSDIVGESTAGVYSDNIYRFKVPVISGVNTYTLNAQRTTEANFYGKPVLDEIWRGVVIGIGEGCNSMLKYIDRNGQYRFMPITSGYLQNNTYENLDTMDRYITSIAESNSGKCSLGKKTTSTRTYSIVNFPKKYVWMLEDLMNSPVVYLHVGESLTSDSFNDWMQVIIQTSILDYSTLKGNFISQAISIEMPDKNNITLI